MRDIDLRSEGKRQKQRLRTLGDLDVSALRLAAGYAPVLDETVSPERLREAIFGIIGRDALVSARESVLSLAVPTEDAEPQRWAEAHARVSGFIVPLLNAVRFEGAPSAKHQLEAMHRLRRTSGTPSNTWDEAPRAFVPNVSNQGCSQRAFWIAVLAPCAWRTSSLGRRRPATSS